RLYEGVRMQELRHVVVENVMQQKVISVQASLTLKEFSDVLSPRYRHSAFPVFEDDELLGIVDVWSIAKVPHSKWESTRIRDLTDRRVTRVSSDCDVMEGLRLLMSEHKQQMLLVITGTGKLKGIVTKTDILHALKIRRDGMPESSSEAASRSYSLVE
ncbi:MAG: CBS domain-containing protein, partial [Edaphobacter sp.]